MNFLLSKKTLLRIAGYLTMVIYFSGCGTSQPAPEPDEITLEYLLSLPETELMNRDSDGDGLSDYDEIFIYGTDPLNPDTDGDGLTDYEEIYVYGTDPLNPDTNGNGFTDGQEVEMGTNPLDPDDPPFLRREDMNIIQFEPGSSELTPEAIRLLDENITKLLHADEFSIELHSYADPTEPDGATQQLLADRAEAVEHYYTNIGIESNRISIADNLHNGVRDVDGNEHYRSVESVPINPYPFEPAF